VSKTKSATPTFEDALAELEQLVQRLEKGDLTLEASLAAFERGVELTRTCEKVLKDAELKVQILSRQDREAPLEPFPSED